jgi:pimeloyl-ACP methyl ester carboxylesterase
MASKRNTTLIILPGWGGSHETWADFVHEAQKKIDADIRVIDLPCFGIEPCPPEVWGVEEYSAFVEKKIRSIQTDTLILLGHSFGGQIAAYVASRHPNLLDGLILSGPAIYRPRHYLKRVLLYPLAKIGALLCSAPLLGRFAIRARAFAYRLIGSPDYSRTSGVQKDIFKKVIRQDVTHCLKNISQNTLILWGENDTHTPRRHAWRIRDGIAESRLVVIDQAGHGIHLHQPKMMTSLIDSYIKGL